MKVSQLKQPYKQLAKFYTEKGKKSNRQIDLMDAFEWGYCVNSNYTKSHWNFWVSVDLGESPEIPKGILNHFNKHNPKQAFTVMGLPKDFSKETEQVAPVNKLKPTKSYDHLLNKMMKGFDFKFDIDNTSLPYVIDMDYYIGQTGKITAVFGDIVEVSFGTLTWMYPSHLAEDHVVEGPEEVQGEVTIDSELKPEELNEAFAALKAMETVHLFADILKGVHSFTGEITPEDIDYHISLIERHLPK